MKPCLKTNGKDVCGNAGGEELGLPNMNMTHKQTLPPQKLKEKKGGNTAGRRLSATVLFDKHEDLIEDLSIHFKTTGTAVCSCNLSTGEAGVGVGWGGEGL